MTRRSRAVMLAGACLVLALSAAPAWGKPMFHPRVRNALGLVPPVNSQGKFAAQADVASGAPTPVTYHGGAVMAGGVTMHLIFWTGGTNPFQGGLRAPRPTTSAWWSSCSPMWHMTVGSMANIFSVLPQFAQGTAPGAITPGDYSIAFNARQRQRRDHGQRSVPGGGRPVRVAQRHGDLHHRRPGADRGRSHRLDPRRSAAGCTTCGSCSCRPASTNASPPACAGPTPSAPTTRSRTSATARRSTPSRSIRSSRPSVVRRAPTRRATPTPRRRWTPTSHETVEAMTDPEGIGWMDPNGFEVADKCEFGPQRGHPARLRAGRLAVQPGHQRPRVPVPADVVKRRQRLRPAHEPDRATRCRCRRSTSRSSARWSAATSSPARRASA